MSQFYRPISDFERIAEKQDKKGIKHYGKPLDPFDAYDWLVY